MPLEPEHPIVRVVDAPSPSADVRFDFNDGLAWPEHDGFDLGAPALLGAPGGVNAEWDYRRVSFRTHFQGFEHAARAKYAELARVLMMPRNFLLYQWTPESPPVWLEVVQPVPGSLQLSNASTEDAESRWAIDVAFVAEPFALGEQVSHTLTITNDPADGGLCAVLPEIKGDAPAPLNVELESGDTGDAYSLLSVAAVDADYDALQFWQAESGTLGTDAAVEVNASSSGGSRVSVDFGTDETMVQRLAVGGIPPLAGRYRIFARVVAVNCSATVTLSTSSSPGGIPRPSVSAMTPSVVDGDEALVELGVYAWPTGNPPTRRPYELSSASDTVLIDARRDSGSGSLKIDYVVAIPADLPLDQAAPPRSLEWATDGVGAPTSNLIRRVDSDAGRAVLVSLTGKISHALDPAWATQPIGGFPQVVPGFTNVAHFLPRHKVGDNWSDDLDASTEVRVWYHPLHLWLPGS